MDSNLRPLGLTEVLDHAVTLYRKNFLLLVGIMALVQIPLSLLQIITTSLTLPVDFTNLSSATGILSRFVSLGAALIVGLVGALVSVFQIGALTFAVSERYHERPANLKESYRRALQRWDSLLLVLIMVGGANLLVFAVFFAPFFFVALAGTQLSSSAAIIATLLLPLLCLGLVPATLLLAFLDVRWAFSIQTVLLENLNAVAGLRRSWNLVSGHFFRILGAGILLILFVYALTLVPTSLVQVGVAMLIADSLLLATVLSYVVSALIGIIIAPIQYTVLTLLYYDLRIRKEGYDLALRAQALQSAAPLTPAEQGT